MSTGVQFNGTLAANQTLNYFTWGWNPALHVIWHMLPTSPQSGAPQIDWDVTVERANATQCTYWLKVRNLTGATVTFEGRYAIMN